MTKLCPVLAVLCLAILGSARRFGPVTVKKEEEMTDDAFGRPRNHEITLSGAEAHQILEPYKGKLEEIGTKEVLMEHGMGQISELDAERIVNAAEGMVGTQMKGGGAVSEIEAQKIVSHYEDILEEIGAEKVINELAILGELDLQAASNAVPDTNSPAKEAQHSASHHKRNAQEIEAEKNPSHSGSALLENEAHKIVRDGGGNHKQHYHYDGWGKGHVKSHHKRNAQEIGAEKNPSHSGNSLFENEAHKIVRDGGGNHKQHYHHYDGWGEGHGKGKGFGHGRRHVEQMVSNHGTQGAHKEALLETAKHGLAHVMHLDGSPARAVNPKTVSGNDPSKSSKAEQALGKYRKSFSEFSEGEVQKAQKIIGHFNEAEKRVGEYDKMISETEAQKMISAYKKTLTDFGDQKSVSYLGDLKKFSHSEAQNVHGEHKVVQAGFEQSITNSGIEKIVDAPTTKTSKSNSPQKYEFDKTFIDFKNIVDDIGSEKSQALYRDLLESLAGHADKVGNPDSLSKPAAESAPAPLSHSSLAQVQEIEAEKKDGAAQFGNKAYDLSETLQTAVNEDVTDTLLRDTVISTKTDSEIVNGPANGAAEESVEG